MENMRVVLLAAAVAMTPVLAEAESRFSVNRAGGVDATGANTDGRLSGYNSRSFSELASLNTPTVDLTPIQNQITNLENQINTNITSMSDLSDRVSANEGGISSNAGNIAGAYDAANSARTRADSAYSRASSAYSRATSAQSTASSAYSTANTKAVRAKITKVTSRFCRRDYVYRYTYLDLFDSSGRRIDRTQLAYECELK
ncbi:hypothetical protein [Marinobacter shengliensis]|uniref:hypothetical protein n=1 Tax=Marinobacter shengliensis TaxID=1389223 RepID=UPI001109C7AD|nr:hypothetical protein [Marinobacter shengliensis]